MHHPFDLYPVWKKEYGDLVKLDIGIKIAVSFDTTQWEKVRGSNLAGG